MGRDAYFIGLDLGTQSLRALLTTDRGAPLACVRRPTPMRRVDRVGAEYDPDALWQGVLDLLRELATMIPPGGGVAGIACASIGESCVLVDEQGQALAPAIAWFDRRTERDARDVAAAVGVERLFRITGYPPDPTLSLCKLLWHRREQPDVFARTWKALPIAPWIAFRLTGLAAVDLSLASRTLCLDAQERAWSPEVLGALDMTPDLLPEIRPSGDALGPVRAEVLAATGLPGRPVVAVGAQDHVCGGFVAGATRPGVLLDSLGTAEALLATAEQPPLTAALHELGFMQSAVGLHRPFYLVGSGINRSGGAIEWACAALGDGTPRDRLIEAARGVPAGSGGVCFLPHLAYSSAPNPDVGARGAFVGLTDGTDRAALFRAVLEGVAMEARVVADALTALPGVAVPDGVRVIGGGTRNALLLEIKASVFGRPLTVFDEPEVTALGAALLGGVGAGVWRDFDEALASVDLKTTVVAPRPAWARYYDDLFGSVYSGLYGALKQANQGLSAVEARAAAAMPS